MREGDSHTVGTGRLRRAPVPIAGPTHEKLALTAGRLNRLPTPIQLASIVAHVEMWRVRPVPAVSGSTPRPTSLMPRIAGNEPCAERDRCGNWR